MQDIYQKIADDLWQARLNGQQIAQIGHPDKDLTIEDAYAISRINFQRRRSESKAVGKKIGLTSKAVQSQLQVDEPDFGFLTADMQVENGGKLAAASLIQPRVEGEVAFILHEDLARDNVTADDIIGATESIAVCIEIIDSRVKDWKIRIQDTVADNASSAAFVLGDSTKLTKDFDLRMMGMTLLVNDEVSSTGVGAACMQTPLNAVAWLANRMHALGDSLRAGDVVLSGAYGPIVPVSAGDKVEVKMNGLGSCKVEFN